MLSYLFKKANYMDEKHMNEGDKLFARIQTTNVSFSFLIFKFNSEIYYICVADTKLHLPETSKLHTFDFNH